MGGCVPSREAHSASDAQLLLVGLDGSGSTTVLYQVAFNGQLQTIPTLAIIQEEIKVGTYTCTLFDVGGMSKIRPIWRQYGSEADGVVFVVDSANRSRFKEAAEELKKLFAASGGKTRGKGPGKKKPAPSAPDAPLLIFANKQDLKNAASAEEIEEALHLRQLPVKSYRVFECCARSGTNVNEGFKWLTDQLKGTPSTSKHKSKL